MNRALAIADSNWFTTENLFRALDRDDTETLLLSCMDYRNAWRKGARPWKDNWGHPVHSLGARLWRAELVLPSGWMKTFPRLGMRPIARTVRSWRRRHAPASPLTLVMTYPYYLVLRDLLRPEYSVYYNLDDYTLYWPQRAEEVRAVEARAVRAADLTICVSRLRAEELRAQIPEASSKIQHLPHGTPAAFLSASPCHRPAEAPSDLDGLPRPLLGYVGSMGDREDWALLTRLADEVPGASLILIGRPPAESVSGQPWIDDYRALLRRPNVHALGFRSQAELPRYLQAFDVNLIPYRVDHPFNRACSPTKIMDGMGCGRPIVSTDIPECRLYADLIDVATDADDFVARVLAILQSQSDDGRAAARHDYATRHTCALVARRFLDLIPVAQTSS